MFSKEQFTTATPLSKALAMVVFIILPFVAFFLGMNYGKQSVPPVETLVFPATDNIEETDFAQETGGVRNLPDGWVEYRNGEFGFSFYLPEDWKVSETRYDPTRSATAQLFRVGFGPPESVHDFMGIQVLDVNFDDAISNDWFEGILKNSTQEGAAVSNNGHGGIRFNAYNQTDNFYYFYDVNGQTIVFQDTFGGNFYEEESQMIYESFVIN